MQLTVDRARSTLGPLCEGGIQTRMSLAKKGIRSRGEEQKKEEGLKFKIMKKYVLMDILPMFSFSRSDLL